MKYDLEKWVSYSDAWTLKTCRKLMGLPEVVNTTSKCVGCSARVMTQLVGGVRHQFYCPQCHATMKERDGGLTPASFGR